MKIKYRRNQRKYEVIISACRRSTKLEDHMYGNPNGSWVSNFEEGKHFRGTFPTKKLASEKAQPEKGKCVILRPKFNEEDCNGRFFREWRSFDGGELKEIKWRQPY